jgi:membrane-bound ClpP family serine protease
MMEDYREMSTILKRRLPRRKYLLWIGLSLMLFSIISYQIGHSEEEGPLRNIVYHLKLDSDYDPIMANYITRGVEEAKKEGAGLIVVELDTPGGRIDSEWEINDALLSSYVPTVAWVNKRAASAGGATVVACNNLVVARGSEFGAVVPVILSPTGPIELGQKYISYMREHMAAAAEANGINPKLAKAMTDKDIEVSYLEHWEWADENKEVLKEKGLNIDDIPERLKKYRDMQAKYEAEWKREKGITSSVNPPPSAPPFGTGLWPEDFGQRDDDRDYRIPRRERDWRDNLGEKWFITMRGISYTCNWKDAIDLKMALGEVNDIREIFEFEKYKNLKGARIVKFPMSWSESLAKALIPLSGLFLIGGIIGIATELKVPGFGAPGILGILCLALFFFVNFGYSMAEWINVALFTLGLILLAIELFVIPGFGVVGISGIILMLIGIFMSILKKPIPDLPIPTVAFGAALMRLAMYVVATFFIILFLFRFVLPHTPVYSRIVLTYTEDKTKGFHASEGTPLEQAESLIGKVGKSHSFLRPAGKAVFDGKLYDVVTEGDMIGKDETVKIIAVRGNHIVVKKAANSS